MKNKEGPPELRQQHYGAGEEQKDHRLAPLLTPEDLARLEESDWADLSRMARWYCRRIDQSRGRRLVDGSATVVRDGVAPYGTDDVAADVAQDAGLLYARSLAVVSARYEALLVNTEGAAVSWRYIRRDGDERVVTRETLKRWAVHDAAAQNGYRWPTNEDDAADKPGGHDSREREFATSAAIAGLSEVVWRMAYGNGTEFQTIRELLAEAVTAPHLGRAGILATAATRLHGGATGSRRQVIRTKQAALAEWRELSTRLDEARADIGYHSSGGR